MTVRVNEQSRTPIYQQVEDDLRARIRSGEFDAEGGRLPSQATLEAEYGTGRKTVQRALAQLIRDNVVVSRKGVPAMVRPSPPLIRRQVRFSHYRGGVSPFRALAEDAGLDWQQEITELDEVPASYEVAAALDIDVDEKVFLRGRLMRRDGVPMEIANSCYPLDVASAVPSVGDEETGEGGSYARFADAGYALRFVERVQLRRAEKSEALALGLGSDGSVARLTRVAKAKDGGRIVEFFDSVMPSDSYIFEYDFEAAELSYTERAQEGSEDPSG